MLLYGEPRLTRDIDVTLGLKAEELDKVRVIISGVSLKILVENVEDFVKRTMVLPTIDEKSSIRVDFIFSSSLYEKQAIDRAKNVKLGRNLVKFACLEDVVIHKVIASRPRDIEDARSILLKNPEYDSKYIARWLKEFDSSLGENFLGLFKKIVEEIK